MVPAAEDSSNVTRPYAGEREKSQDITCVTVRDSQCHAETRRVSSLYPPRLPVCVQHCIVYHVLVLVSKDA